MNAGDPKENSNEIQPRPLSAEELKAKQDKIDLESSYQQSQALKPLSEKILPNLYPTWEAGRACGFHAGLKKAREEFKAKGKA